MCSPSHRASRQGHDPPSPDTDVLEVDAIWCHPFNGIVQRAQDTFASSGAPRTISRGALVKSSHSEILPFWPPSCTHRSYDGFPAAAHLLSGRGRQPLVGVTGAKSPTADQRNRPKAKDLCRSNVK